MDAAPFFASAGGTVLLGMAVATYVSLLAALAYAYKQSKATSEERAVQTAALATLVKDAGLLRMDIGVAQIGVQDLKSATAALGATLDTHSRASTEVHRLLNERLNLITH